MNTASISSTKTTTSFRLNAELVQRLRSLAKRNNRSLNNYIETILFDFAYSEPNDETIEAINEARSGKRLDRFDMAELDNMISKL
jgi:predicted transcriptional regulator